MRAEIPWNLTAILLGVLSLGVLDPQSASAQEAEGEETLVEEDAEGLADEAPEELPESEARADELEGQGDTATDEDSPSGLGSEPTDDAAEAVVPAEPEPEPEPAVAEEPTPDELGSEDEPDYFGGLEPSAGVMLADPKPPAKPPYTGPFRGGAFRVGLGLGGGSYGDQTYFIVGGGLGYFLVNGLEAHVDTDFWLIGEPTIATVTPGVRYVMWFVPKVHPYVGGFYRHYFVGSGFEDDDSLGVRGGVYLMTGRNSYFGLGVAYEKMLQGNLFADDEFVYPEIAFAFAF